MYILELQRAKAEAEEKQREAEARQRKADAAKLNEAGLALQREIKEWKWKKSYRKM